MFHVTPDGNYLVDAYNDTVVVVVLDTVVVQGTTNGGSLAGFWQADGWGALAGGASLLLTGCEFYTLGTCIAGSSLIGAAIESSKYAFENPDMVSGGGGAGASDSPCGGDAYPVWEPQLQATVCELYPSGSAGG